MQSQQAGEPIPQATLQIPDEMACPGHFVQSKRAGRCPRPRDTTRRGMTSADA